MPPKKTKTKPPKPPGVETRGRPTKCTPEIQAAIVEGVSTGLYAEKAAVAAGVTPRTFYSWMEQGEAGDGREPYASFALAIEAARATKQRELLKQINDRLNNWQALAWILERSDPENWALRQVIQVKIDKEVELILDTLQAGLSPDVYARCLELIASRADTGRAATRADQKAAK